MVLSLPYDTLTIVSAGINLLVAIVLLAVRDRFITGMARGRLLVYSGATTGGTLALLSLIGPFAPPWLMLTLVVVAGGALIGMLIGVAGLLATYWKLREEGSFNSER